MDSYYYIEGRSTFSSNGVSSWIKVRSHISTKKEALILYKRYKKSCKSDDNLNSGYILRLVKVTSKVINEDIL